MSTFVRASKFRHVYCDPPRIDATFQGIRVSQATGEQNYIKANSLFFATGIQVLSTVSCIITASFSSDDVAITFYHSY